MGDLIAALEELRKQAEAKTGEAEKHGDRAGMGCYLTDVYHGGKRDAYDVAIGLVKAFGNG
jgi:hypothetical protein